MLELPSTTEVGRRLPKEAFYRNLKLDARTRGEFVHLIEGITVTNSVKPTTANIADGDNVHEIMVLKRRAQERGPASACHRGHCRIEPAQARVPLRAEQHDLRASPGIAGIRLA